MFTGIVEETGEVLGLERFDRSGRLTIRARVVADGLRLGDSVAVNGCCLTLASADEGGLSFDLLGETLERTNLGSLTPGMSVNLERALAATGRLGGHFVQGHIDCPSEILRFETVGRDHRLQVALPPEFAHLAAFKGSIAVDGISLTVAEVTGTSLAVWIIPHTLAATNLGARRPGDRVNLEFDLLAKYVERLAAVRP
jgi:riboflavin synthase